MVDQEVVLTYLTFVVNSYEAGMMVEVLTVDEDLVPTRVTLS